MRTSTAPSPTPPEGYTLPAAAARLVAHAQAHGWTTLVQWLHTEEEDGAPYVVVKTGHVGTPEQLPEDAPRNSWRYTYTWHSFGCAPGRLRPRQAAPVRQGDRRDPGPPGPAGRADAEGRHGDHIRPSGPGCHPSARGWGHHHRGDHHAGCRALAHHRRAVQ